MTRFGIRVAIAFVLVAGTATYWIMSAVSPADPECKGIRLTQWLQMSEREWDKRPIQPADLRAVGPSAASYLAHFIERVRPWERKSIAARAPYWLRSRLPDSCLEPSRGGSREQCQRALSALTWLGPDAEPALPVLLSLLEDSDSTTRELAAGVIHSIGSASWPAVHRILRQGTSRARRDLMFTISDRTATEHEKALIVEILVEACRDPDSEIQVVAVGALGNCRLYEAGSPPHFAPAMPAIIRCITQGHGLVQVVAANSLRNYDSEALAAVPALEQMTSDPDPYISSNAREVLSDLKARWK